jgi:hypothetical protein
MGSDKMEIEPGICVERVDRFVREDLRLMGVEEEEAEDRDCWRFRLDCMRFMANL